MNKIQCKDCRFWEADWGALFGVCQCDQALDVGNSVTDAVYSCELAKPIVSDGEEGDYK